MLEILFYSALFLTIYTYLIFPILLFVLTKLVKNRAETALDLGNNLSVAILCAMYNEEKVVDKKMENFLNLDYDNIKLYIGSDGSSDKTNELLSKYSHIKNLIVYEFPRRGKVYVINDLMARVEEDIIIFTDANSMFEADVIRNLAKHFSDLRVGAVCGRLKLVHRGHVTGEGFYWRYETFIKKLESKLNCVIGANGAIYAVRKRLLAPLPVNTINDDFTNSMKVIEQGYGIKYAEDAIAYEEINHDDSAEFRRHIRDGAGHYRAMVHLYKLLNPFKPKVFFLYVSHRVTRWLVPIFLVLLVVLPWFMEITPGVRLVYLSEIVFYVVVLIRWLTRTKIKIFYIPYYFIYINIALLIGLFRNILGIQKVTWNSTSR